MAHKKIREYHAKRLLAKELGLDYEGYLVKDGSELPDLEGKWVVKPDQLFGKRAEHGLVGVGLTIDEVRSWISQKKGLVEVNGKKGNLEWFLVERFIPHEEEHYLAIKSVRDGEEVYYSKIGGTGIEERWGEVKKIHVSVGEQLVLPELGDFANRLLSVFRKMDFVYLEINPIALPGPHLLDAVAEVDDYASFKHLKDWNFEFPPPFGKQKSPEEAHVEQLDKKSGASMKLSVLNPKGKIWLLTAGGGASIVYTDSIAELGLGHELANYGEYSGNPTKDEMVEYTGQVFNLMKKYPGKKYLIIGGAIANFTDVAITFDGIITSIEREKEFFRDNVTVIVRRGGINAEEGLKKIKHALDSMHIENHVFSEDKEITYPAKLVKELIG